MKRLVTAILACAIVLTSCSVSTNKSETGTSLVVEDSSSNAIEITTSTTMTPPVHVLDFEASYTNAEIAEQFYSVQDEELLTYLEEVVYHDLVNDMDDSDYCVEDVDAIYVSQEYIEELTYNSQENVYFGYHLSDVKAAMGETPWFFTTDENGQTVVSEYQYTEFEYNFVEMLKDIAIGTGVILVCATVAIVSAPSMPALSMIMMVSAKTGTAIALSNGSLAALSSGIITYYQTGDIDVSIQAAMDSGGEAFKIGAISGVVLGAAKETLFLHKASNYLTWNQVATIQKQSKYPANVIAEIHNMEEYQALADGHLKPVLVGGKTALIPEDIEFTDDNIRLMMDGYAPLDENGIKYELHHIGQENDATLALLTREQHDNPALHGFQTKSQIDRPRFNNTIRPQFYKDLVALLTEGG